MRSYSFIALSFCIVFSNSCLKTKRQAVNSSHPITDSIVPAQPVATIDSMIYRQKDSFYALPFVALLVSDNKFSAYQKLIASVLDTNGITWQALKFEQYEEFGYADEEPVSQRTTLRGRDFLIEVIEDSINVKNPLDRKIIINGNRQRFGKELDFKLAWEAIRFLLRLNVEHCKIFTAGSNRYLYLQGYVDRCTGLACGITFHLVYDPAANKSFAFSQLRNDDFLVGYDVKKKCLQVCVIEEEQYNEQLEFFPLAGKVYRFMNGKVTPVLNNDKKQASFIAYTKRGNFDSITVLTRTKP